MILLFFAATTCLIAAEPISLALMGDVSFTTLIAGQYQGATAENMVLATVSGEPFEPIVITFDQVFLSFETNSFEVLLSHNADPTPVLGVDGTYSFTISVTIPNNALVGMPAGIYTGTGFVTVEYL